MKGVLWSIFLTVACVNCVLGSSSISSFIVKSWKTRNSSWVKDAKIYPREDVRLECTTPEFSQVNELHITRADGFLMPKNQTMDIQKDSQSLVVILKSVECSQMGTYLCENGQGDKKTVDLGIYDCPPQPCKDQSTDITLYVSVSKTTQFSMCVEAFPGIGSQFFFNGIELRYNRTNDLPGVNCVQLKLEEVFGTYNISCTITVSSEKNYTVHDFSIPNGMAQNQRLSFAVQIEKPGPPKCPRGVILTNQRKGTVTLSWQPVKNKGGSQPVNYTIFYTTNYTDWQRYITVEDTLATITGLKTDTVHKFRIVSANDYSQVINENTCTDTIVINHKAITIKSTTTITTSSPVFTNEARVEEDSKEQDVKNGLNPVVIAVIVLATIVVVAGVVGLVVCLKIRRFNFQLQTRTGPSRTHRNGCHTQEPAQQASLMDNTSRNVVIDEPVYETVI